MTEIKNTPWRSVLNPLWQDRLIGTCYYVEDSEGQVIAINLDQKTAIIDKIVNNIKTQITTLKELRKTLINDVVTGKVKVTN